MAKAQADDIAAALRKAGRGQGAALGDTMPTVPGRGPAFVAEQEPKRRRHREGRRGIVIYVTPAEHRQLKVLAAQADQTLQELCAQTMRKRIEKRT